MLLICFEFCSSWFHCTMCVSDRLLFQELLVLPCIDLSYNRTCDIHNKETFLQYARLRSLCSRETRMYNVTTNMFFFFFSSFLYIRCDVCTCVCKKLYRLMQIKHKYVCEKDNQRWFTKWLVERVKRMLTNLFQHMASTNGCVSLAISFVQRHFFLIRCEFCVMRCVSIYIPV